MSAFETEESLRTTKHDCGSVGSYSDGSYPEDISREGSVDQWMRGLGGVAAMHQSLLYMWLGLCNEVATDERVCGYAPRRYNGGSPSTQMMKIVRITSQSFFFLGGPNLNGTSRTLPKFTHPDGCDRDVLLAWKPKDTWK
jgi:hypothetical protein